ncbi:hypothetical protein HDV00_011869 [Rhizophlyctis rosea]|nr:hypothetical protein HDV00_011869 [Rhizophlyctis rosea]
MTATDLPITQDDILASGIVDAEFAKVYKQDGDQSLPTDIGRFKQTVQRSLPAMQTYCASTKPANITETEHTISLGDGISSRLVVCHPATQSPEPSPLIVLFHGGGFCVGFPELEFSTARAIVTAHNATVVLPSYRLAPEDPFPAAIDDAWAILQYLAKEATTPHDPTHPILASQTDPIVGFIVGGTSAGASLAARICPLARDAHLFPPITGQLLCAGSFLDDTRIPERYNHMYLSLSQNASAPILNRHFWILFRDAFKPDVDRAIWELAAAPVEHLVGLPKVYFQACGMDPLRDDTLIYEKVLREECGVQTRIDLYIGLPHCWWRKYPLLEASRKRKEDVVEGVAWLLTEK